MKTPFPAYSTPLILRLSKDVFSALTTTSFEAAARRLRTRALILVARGA